MNRITTPVFLILVQLIACTRANEEDLRPRNSSQEPTAPLQNIRLSTDIMPIFRKYGCTTCHDRGSANGIELQDHSSIVTYVTDGRLIGSIEHQSGFAPMPSASQKLTDREIETIKVWIHEGAQNN